MSKEELLKYLIAEIDLIMHDKDYRFENANGTWYSRESCRDLTNEEVFEELRTELRQFADLEARLAEKEKEILELQEESIRDNQNYNEELAMLQEHKFNADNIIKAYADKCKNAQQDKISFAIERLEKVKDIILNERKITTFKFDIFNKGKDTALFWLNEQIDNQINELKEQQK